MDDFSICIPTYGRDNIVDLLESISASIRKANFEPEVIIYFNQIPGKSPSLSSFRNTIERFHFAKLILATKVHNTAESSSYNAVMSSSCKYVWIVGDDDLVTEDSINTILNIPDNNEIGFYLLNLVLEYENKLKQYYELNSDFLEMDRIEFFQKLGFISITTTLSCFLIKKDIVDLKIFDAYHRVQGIYSHSFSLFEFLKNAKACLISSNCVIRSEQKPKQIQEDLVSIGESSYNQIWIEGIYNLLKLCSVRNHLNLEYLSSFREIELIKDPNHDFGTLLVSSTRNVVFRNIINVHLNKNTSKRKRVFERIKSELGITDRVDSSLIMNAPIKFG